MIITMTRDDAVRNLTSFGFSDFEDGRTEHGRNFIRMTTPSGTSTVISRFSDGMIDVDDIEDRIRQYA